MVTRMVAAFVPQLGVQRVVEPAQRVLGSAVGALQRDAAEGECRADLHDRPPVPGHHLAQRGHGAVHRSQVDDLGDPPELLGADLGGGSEHRGHRGVHPGVDRAGLGLHPVRGVGHLIRVRHVHRNRQRMPAGGPHVPRGAGETHLTPGQQRHRGAALGEHRRRGAADPAAGTGHHDHR